MDHNLPSVSPDISVAVVVISVLLITGVSSVVLVYSCDTDSVLVVVSFSTAEDNDVKALTASSEISVVVPKLDTEISVAYDELYVVYDELSVVSVLECTLVSVVKMELSDVVSVVAESVVVDKSELRLVCIISPEPLSSIVSGSPSPPMSGCVYSMLPMPEPVNVLITSVFRSVPVVIPEPSPEPVSKVISEEVLILEKELDAISDVESVGSVL